MALVLIAACGTGVCPDGYFKEGDRCRLPGNDGDNTVTTVTAGGNADTSTPPVDAASGSSAPVGAGGSGANVMSTAGSASSLPGSSSGPISMDPCAGKTQSSVCNGPAMLHCSASGQTLTSDACENAMFCALGQTGGKCAVCSPGTFRCTGAMLERCGDDGQYTFAKTCDSAALCKETAGDCTTQLCTPNTKVCDATGMLSTCNADGSALVEPQTCGAGMCDMKLGQCYKCVPGAIMCMGAGVSECSADGQTQILTACPTAECKLTSCMGGQCISAPAPAKTKCASANVCDDASKCVGCITNDDCDSTELCSSGMCIVKACSPNMAICTSSGALQICDATGSMVAETKACGARLCDQADRACYNCVPNEETCKGDTAVACLADGSRATETKCSPRGDDCTTASCTGGACTFGVKAQSSSCTGGKCSAAGQCVPCLTGDKMSCTDLPSGQCGPGTKTCQGNAWGACTGTKGTDDVCGGGNTDCDANTDEACTGKGDMQCQENNCVTAGSYTDACKKCSQSGTSLTCDCPNGQNKVATTTVSLTSGCQPTNCSGQLSCIDCWQQILNQGSFDESNDKGVVSCEQCTYNYKSVNCQCRKKDGTLVAASTYDLPCPAGLWNDDGMLKCSGH